MIPVCTLEITFSHKITSDFSIPFPCFSLETLMIEENQSIVWLGMRMMELLTTDSLSPKHVDFIMQCVIHILFNTCPGTSILGTKSCCFHFSYLLGV